MPKRAKEAEAGYSGTPLLEKLGIRDGHRVAILDAPDRLPEPLATIPGAEVERALRGAPFDVVLLFAVRNAGLEKRFRAAKGRLQPAGGLWVAWPKRASGVPTDLTEDRIRSIALAAGLVDNKVCAIDETWSALRCVIRLKDRPR
jgi:hypothetical protein